MFLIGAVLIGLVLGYLRGGRVAHLAQLRLRSLWLVGIALAIQLAIFPLFRADPLLPYATSFFHLLSYGLALVFLVLNYRAFPFLGIGLGALLNLLTITVNGGYMPSSPAALIRAGHYSVAARLLEEGVCTGTSS